MYPRTSTCRSGEGGALWGYSHEGTKTLLWQSQWTTIVKRFQRQTRTLLRHRYFVFLSPGNCEGADTLEALSVLARGEYYDRDELIANGAWNDATAAAFGALLCASNQSQVAQQLWVAKTSKVWTEELARQV